MKHDEATVPPAPLGQVERGVGRLVPERAEYAGVRCMCVMTGCRAGPGCPHYCGHCKAHIAFSGRPHDAGTHGQPMTPAVQRVIDEADRRARDKAAMPAACPTPTGCREHGCHGECMPPNVELTGTALRAGSG
jgi:hypothetical protein